MLAQQPCSFLLKVFGKCGEAALALVVLVSVAQAQNRFYFDNPTLAIGSSGDQIPLLADLDQDTYAFSVHVRFDTTKLAVTSVQLGADTAPLTPEYFEGETSNVDGSVIYGVVFDLSDPVTERVAPASGLELLTLTVDVVAGSPTTANLTFQNDTSPPWSRNVVTDENGDSVVGLSLQNGSVTISSFEPVITGFVSNAGEPGAVFFVTGENFDQPGRSVTVGGRLASASLLADNETLRVTAPDCTSSGPAEVVVCTDYGCDSDPAGFDYDCPGPPVILSISGNAGPPGTLFTIVGEQFHRANLSVTVGGRTPIYQLQGDDRTIEVTAPACDGDGAVEVVVCTDLGCDSDPAGFDYDCPAAPVIISLSNNSGSPGQLFSVTGTDFDQSGLQVRVGGRPANVVSLVGDTLQATAPICVDEGAADVEVCTDLGCDTEVGGFDYTGGCTNSPQPPAIISLAGNAGEPGTVFTVFGDNFTEPGLAVRVGGRAAADFMLLADDRTIEVTAPGCDGDGLVSVQVCTDFGCDTEPSGFDYDCPGVPVITSISGNNGEPGQEFTITGEDLDRAGVTVNVGGMPAAVSIEPDGSLRVTAPACPTEAVVPVQVCTDLGCDTETAGFTYTGGCADSDLPPVITGFADNAGVAGAVFRVFGENFDEPGLSVTVDGQAAAFELLPGAADPRTIEVTAPSCTMEGSVAVEVCTDFGCASDASGFLYTSCGETFGPFIRGDCNQDGDSDGSPTDGIFLLTFLFLGGPEPKCLAACDMDGNGDVEGAPTDALYFFNFNFLGGAPIPEPRSCDSNVTRPGDLAMGCDDPAGCP